MAARYSRLVARIDPLAPGHPRLVGVRRQAAQQAILARAGVHVAVALDRIDLGHEQVRVHGREQARKTLVVEPATTVLSHPDTHRPERAAS